MSAIVYIMICTERRCW